VDKDGAFPQRPATPRIAKAKNVASSGQWWSGFAGEDPYERTKSYEIKILMGDFRVIVYVF
jgi:hypothetical protein